MPVETRPGPVEDWLDSLPYADFERATGPMLEALRQTNAEKIKPNVRMQLAELYARPYEYLLDTHVRQQAHSVANTRERQRQRQRLTALCAIATEIAFCCRLAIDEALTRRTRWINSKPPVRCMLLAMRMLSQRLLLCYHSYAPTPANLWHEVHDLYASAEKLRVLDQSIVCSWRDDEACSSIGACYRQIVATALIDPHHLPEAAAWSIHAQLEVWQTEIELHPWSAEPEQRSNLFVLALMSDQAPVNGSRWRINTQAADTLRILDCSALHARVTELQQQLSTQGHISEKNPLAGSQAAVLLPHLLKAWGTPPRRRQPRQRRQGRLQLVSGLHAVYQQLQAANPQPEQAGQAGEAIEEIELSEAGSAVSSPTSGSELWEFVNAGPGGYSVYKAEPPSLMARVGDVVIVRTQPEEPWQLGLIRWLMVQKNRQHRIGIQFISAHFQAVTFSDSSQIEHHGLLLSDQQDSLISQRGSLSSGTELRIKMPMDQPRRQVGQLLERTATVEHVQLLSGSEQHQDL